MDEQNKNQTRTKKKGQKKFRDTIVSLIITVGQQCSTQKRFT